MARILTHAELSRLAEELGIDAVGAAPAEPYANTERHIVERRRRGLFADMRFTMAIPEVSCHPERLFPEARTVVAAALSYYAPAAAPEPGEGRLPRYAWSDAYAVLRERLEALGSRLGGVYRVLVDANQHVDREGAARAGVGFYGKNTLLITRRYGSWVVLGTLVTEAEIESTAPLALDCGTCRLCIDACPTGALDQPGELDANRCLSYWTQAPDAIPEEFREELGAQVYGCDICQDVCPWNRGTEKRRAGAEAPAGAESVVSLADWLEAEDDELSERYDRLYFPRNDPRYLRRNALVAAGNSGDRTLLPIVERYAEGGDELLREHAEWAARRLVGDRVNERQRMQEIWIAWARMLAVAFAAAQVAVVSQEASGGAAPGAWIVTGILAAGALVFLVLARRPMSSRNRTVLGAVALTFDTAIIWAFVFTHSFSAGTAGSRLLVLAVIEAAVRYGVAGGVGLTLVNIPLLVVAEATRPNATSGFEVRNVTLTAGIQLITGLVVGGLTRQLHQESSRSEIRAAEAEHLRDEIGRHADRLELANRCARALASSLDMHDSFQLFARELRSAFAYDRIALVLAEGGRATVVAEEGVSADLGGVQWSRPLEESSLGDVIRSGQTQLTRELREDSGRADEAQLAEIGMRSRVIAPLTIAGKPLGVLSVSRRASDAFTAEDVELLTLLGRQLATAVENIRAYESARAASDELKRLSAMRADFVSLVTHELRGPMASVVGCAATLRQRWRTLTPEQRESFLALIEVETSRLAALVGDVLDTSRLEAGTFTYSFSDVDLENLVREVASVVALGQEEVAIRTEVPAPLPAVRGDRERIRQVVMNLLTNAVKYTVPGDEVEVRARVENGAVSVSVTDHGPGISTEDQKIIFQKFGRTANAGSSSTPGTGLGLFIARSISEAHGGSLEVYSKEGAGSTFTVRLPVSSS